MDRERLEFLCTLVKSGRRGRSPLNHHRGTNTIVGIFINYFFGADEISNLRRNSLPGKDGFLQGSPGLQPPPQFPSRSHILGNFLLKTTTKLKGRRVDGRGVGGEVLLLHLSTQHIPTTEEQRVDVGGGVEGGLTNGIKLISVVYSSSSKATSHSPTHSIHMFIQRVSETWQLNPRGRRRRWWEEGQIKILQYNTHQ